MSADRQQLIEIIEATHEFPGDYPLSIIVLNDSAVQNQVRMAVDAGLPKPLPDSACTVVASSRGRYISLRFMVPCENADDVLAVHERVKGIPGIIKVL
jgi:putative lipoic acid-binding regulatory protein